MRRSKEFLRVAENIDAHIDACFEEVLRWQDKATHITSNLLAEKTWNQKKGKYEQVGVEKSGRGMPGDKIGNSVAAYVDIQNEDLSKLFEQRQYIIRTLRKLAEPDHFKVLHKRYIEHRNFNEIGDEMDLSYSSVTTLHGQAINELDHILEVNYEPENSIFISSFGNDNADGGASGTS